MALAGGPGSGSGSGGPPAARIWTGRYVALVLVMLLTFANHMALVPVIPLYVGHLGGTELAAGVVLAAFSLTSFVLRPPIGRLADTWNAGWIAMLGCVLVAAATVGMIAPVLVLVALANMVRGAGWAAFATGTHVALARLAPYSRRGEASGYFSLAIAASGVFGPPAALYWLSVGGSHASVLLVCAGSVAIAAFIARPLRQVHQPPHDGRAAESGPGRAIIARSAVLPAVLVILVMTTEPAVLAFVPLYAERIGIAVSGVTAFYVTTGAFALLSRAMLGRLSDWLGRGVLILSGFALVTVALVALLRVDSSVLLATVGALYAIGQGMTLPALTAVAIERAEQSQVGLAMATYSASYQVGLGAGGLLAGVLISAAGYHGLYLTMAAVAALGLVFTAVRWSALRRPAGV
jgi:predicted MFS family arabinose efflux permease